jgi:acyl-CoA dehydrogenase
MDCGFSAEVVQLGNGIRSYLERHGGLSRRQETGERSSSFDDVLWQGVLEQGWHRVWDAPVDDREALDAGIATLIELGRCLGALPLAPRLLAGWLSNQVDGARLAGLLDDDLLTVAFVGEAVGAGAFRVVEDAGTQRLVGEAAMAPDAAVARVLLIVAERKKDRVLVPVRLPEATVDVIARASAGRRREALVKVSGMVLREHMVTSLPAKLVDELTALSMAAEGAELVGMSRALVTMTVSYARDRQQFDQPLFDFQAVRHHIADMHSDTTLMAALWHDTVARVGRGGEVEAAGAAALWTRDACPRIVGRAHQIHGGVGFIREHPLHLFFGRAQAARASFAAVSQYRDAVLSARGVPPQT